MDTDGGPQVDDGGEQGLIIRTSFILSGAHQATQVSDERLMILFTRKKKSVFICVLHGKNKGQRDMRQPAATEW